MLEMSLKTVVTTKNIFRRKIIKHKKFAQQQLQYSFKYC